MFTGRNEIFIKALLSPAPTPVNEFILKLLLKMTYTRF